MNNEEKTKVLHTKWVGPFLPSRSYQMYIKSNNEWTLEGWEPFDKASKITALKNGDLQNDFLKKNIDEEQLSSLEQDAKYIFVLPHINVTYLSALHQALTWMSPYEHSHYYFLLNHNNHELREDAISSRVIIDKLESLIQQDQKESHGNEVRVSIADLPNLHRLILFMLRHSTLFIGLVPLSQGQIAKKCAIKESLFKRHILWLRSQNFISSHNGNIYLKLQFIKAFAPAAKKALNKELFRLNRRTPINNHQYRRIKRMYISTANHYSTERHEQNLKSLYRFITEFYLHFSRELKFRYSIHTVRTRKGDNELRTLHFMHRQLVVLARRIEKTA
ncbi:hypothetical protein L1D19_23330 [Vibrio natriegens]|uniref:hypothetical protein n=1 Tax=Vibrio natriegens TaxID=691 RepID=UPI001EFEB1DB|nr:hypothetical protein [Vibrio natriegens]MCG9703001.1 hypothetical protein [Vibrio natriegens]